jgi:hypothetical protein
MSTRRPNCHTSYASLGRHAARTRPLPLPHTQPPIVAACVLCQLPAGLCFEHQIKVHSVEARPKGESRGAINVLAIITLYDINLVILEHEST